MLLLLLVAGCGKTQPPQGRVQGQVTLNGSPLSAGQVEFYSADQGIGALAEIGAGGRYSVKDPLQVGEYAVTVRDAVAEPGRPAPKNQMIPRKYADAGTSGLTHTVSTGTNQYDIPLLSKK